MAKKSTHTPGPWKLMPEEVDRDYIRVRGDVLGCRYKIANVVTPTHEGSHSGEAEETRANARLIAAAPDLLEACQSMLIAFKQIPVPDFGTDAYNVLWPARDKLTAAIAKATGTN